MIVFEVLGWLAILIAFYFIIRPFVSSFEHYDNDETVKFYFFYTTWCGWSKKAWPHWNELKRLFETRTVTYGGKPIQLVEVDAEKQRDLAKQFRVKGYPSFRLQTPDKVFEYEGAPSVEKFREFLRRTVGYELVE